MKKGNYTPAAPDLVSYLNLTRDYCFDTIGYDSEFPRVYYDLLKARNKSVLDLFSNNMVKDPYFANLLNEARENDINFNYLDIYTIAYSVIVECFINEILEVLEK